MKNKFLFLIIISLYYFLFTDSANAAIPEPTVSEKPKATPTSIDNPSVTDGLNQQINALKSRIASRVAQLKLVEKRGIVGTVTDASDTQITLSDYQDNKRFIDVDELTRFSSPSAKEAFGISDITKGTKIGVLGLYNKESRRTLARFVNVLELPKIFHGTVSSVDSKNYSFILTTGDNQDMSFYVETSTKTLSYSKDAGLTRSGFSKIKEDQRVIVIGETDSKNKNLITASKIILLPEIPKNPNLKKQTIDD